MLRQSFSPTQRKTRHDLHHAALSSIFDLRFSTFAISRTIAETLASPESQRVPPDAAAGSPADDHAHDSTHAHSNGRHSHDHCRCHSPTRAAEAAPDYR